ncbi:MAG TPA: zf-HC2 domain-containing protein [Ktedonobacteraceae bacterium]|jgi:hypothetical protein
MNCEQVEERLSAYLDNMLAPDERRAVTIHLQTCSRCMVLLAELRQNDILLAQLPRVGPTPTLRERLFSMAEVRVLSELVDYPPHLAFPPEQPQTFASADRPTLDLSERHSYPRLVSLAGERNPRADMQSGKIEIPPTPPTLLLHPTSRLIPQAKQTREYHPPRSRKQWFTPLKIAIATAFLMTLGTAGLLVLSFHHRASSANLVGAITPPAGPLTGAGPLAAGERFVFLRDGALWSTLAEGSNQQPERLTPANVTVAPGWVVSAPAGNHAAGDLLAYIDLQRAQIHTIRSDGQQDTPIQLVLLKANTAVDWQSSTAQIILNSLAWSPDSSTLAFVADPTGSGPTALYLATPGTSSAREIATDFQGNFAHLAWSPDSTRLAFTLTHAGIVNVRDYNLQSKSSLDLSNLTAAQGNDVDGVFALNWFANAGQMAVTWCLGSLGHISSVWLHSAGANGTIYPQQLLSGEYLQALYSPGSNKQTGGWLLIASSAGQAGDIWRLDLTAGGQLIRLSQGKQVSFARWSPDGSSVFYLDNVVNGLGNGHLVNVVTGTDQLLPDQVAISPAPDWSADALQLAYSTGTQIDIAHTLSGNQLTHLRLRGQITNLAWSASAIHQLIVSLGSPNPGLYLVDTQQNTAHQLDSVGTTSVVQWTEIP